MRTLNKIKIAIAALFVGLLCSSPLESLAQNENGVTDQGESTTKVNSSYVNENGKFVCWPRVSPNGKLLTYGPVVTTDSVNSITSTTATLYGNVVHDGWCGVTEQGFEVSTDANFTTIVATVVMNPQPSFTPCVYPACLCTRNKYKEGVSGLTAGTHYYYRAYAKNPCDPDPSYGDTLEFDTPGAAFTVSVTPDDAVVFCPGATGSQNLTYTVSYSPSTIPSPTFQWYFDGTAVSGENGTTYTRTYTNSVGSHTVKCEVTSSGVTRDGSVTTAVSNYAVPSLAVSGDASICVGATGNLTASTGFDTYVWSSNVTSSSTNTATYTAAGTYTVTATTSDGCTATATKTVTVTDPQVASATGITGNTTICSGSTTTLTANATASSGASLQYQWKKNGTAISGATSASYTTEALTANTSYSCDITAVQDGCTSAATTLSAAVTIEESTLASVSIAPATQTICAGETATMTANAGSYNGTLSYQWKQGTTNVGTSASYTTGALSATTTYTCVVTNTTTHGCVTSLNANATVTVTTPAVAISSITASPSTICVGETATLTPTMGSYTGTLSYAWSTGATTASLTTGAINAATTYTLTVTATSGSCTATATKSITVTPTNTSATTYAVASVTCVSATLQGVNTACSDGRGFVYSATNSNPTVGGTGCTDLSVPNGTGNFSYALTGLTPNTTYHVRAYSHSAGGYVYGTVKDFTTDPITLTMSAQDKNINLCQLPHQTVVTISATPNCDESHISNYTWSLSPGAPTATYTQSSDGKTITVTVSTSTKINVSATCTLHHVSGYTNSKMDYSIIDVYGDQPEICVCEDSYNGTVTLTNPPAAQISSIVWQQQGGAGYSTSTVGMNTSDPATPEGYYDVTITNTYGCQASREVILGFPFRRCAHIAVTGATTETEDAHGVWQITDSRTANGNSATTYRVVQIGSQCWMAENLRYKQSMDGSNTSIPRTDLVNVSIYNYPLYFTWPTNVTFTNGGSLNSTQMTSRYGYLYSWIGAMDAPSTASTRGTMYPEVVRDFHIQGVCPDGWHLPTDGEWFQLEHRLGVPQSDSSTVTLDMRPETAGNDTKVDSRGASAKAGAKAATGCEWWGYGQSISSSSVNNSPEDLCNIVRDSIGFSAVPAGVFVPEEENRSDCFKAAGGFANFWSATQGRSAHAGHDDFSDAAYARQLVADGPGWNRYRADKHNGMNVRCVRDMVTTASASATTSSITVGGTVLEDAGYVVTERGICWSNSGTPSISGSHRAVGSGVGSFTTTLTTSDISTGEYQYCAYAINSEGVYYGLTQTMQILSTPAVETGSATDISTSPSNSITLHGNLISTGGEATTVRGICWGTSANPTLSDNVATATGSGTGEYSVTITPPSASTTYHYCAYATNSLGTVYGNDMTFVLSPCAGHNTIQIQGDNYTLIEVGSQCWTTNLHVTEYADGTPIPRGNLVNGGWSAFSDPNPLDGIYKDPYYYEPYNANSGLTESDWAARVTTWGRLYNWLAATRGESGSQVQGICPNGWHVPTLADWQALMAATPSTFAACDVCKAERWPENTTVTGSPGWGMYAQRVGGIYAYVNATHFSVDAAGIINPYNEVHGGVAYGDATPSAVNLTVNYWCADGAANPYYIWFEHNRAGLNANNDASNYNARNYGFYVRCVKN